MPSTPGRTRATNFVVLHEGVGRRYKEGVAYVYLCGPVRGMGT